MITITEKKSCQLSDFLFVSMQSQLKYHINEKESEILPMQKITSGTSGLNLVVKIILEWS